MKNDDFRKFVDRIRFGDELRLLFDGKVFFPERRTTAGTIVLCLYEMRDGREMHVRKQRVKMSNLVDTFLRKV